MTVGINDIKEAINNARSTARSLEKTHELSSSIADSVDNKEHLDIANRTLWQEKSYGLASIDTKSIIERSAKEAELAEWLNSKDVVSYDKYIEAKDGTQSQHEFLKLDSSLYKKLLISCSVSTNNPNNADLEKLLADAKDTSADHYVLS